MVQPRFDAQTLILVFEDGIKPNGDPRYVRKSIRSIVETDEFGKLYDLAEDLAKLYKYPLSHVLIDRDTILEKEEV